MEIRSVSTGELDDDRVNCAPDSIEQGQEGFITLGATNLADRYLKNMLAIHLHGVWRSDLGVRHFCGTVIHRADLAGIVNHLEGLRLIRCGAHNYQFPMLVDVVQEMQDRKVIVRRTVPGMVWLQSMNECSGLGTDLAESLYFSNVFSKFLWVVPRVVDVNGKLCSFAVPPAVGEMQQTGEMVETRSQIVQNLSGKNGETGGGFSWRDDSGLPLPQVSGHYRRCSSRSVLRRGKRQLPGQDSGRSLWPVLTFPERRLLGAEPYIG